jgi:hypothetical protein
MAAKTQDKSKFSQIQQSQHKIQPNFSKERAWISLDSLVRNEPFQWVIATPWAKKVLPRYSPPEGRQARLICARPLLGGRGRRRWWKRNREIHHGDIVSFVSIFQKELSKKF